VQLEKRCDLFLANDTVPGAPIPAITAPADGMRQITVGPDEDDSSAWSPDGQKIAYVSIHEGTSHICVMNTDGTGIRPLTSGAGQNIHPMWSPDSSRILFNTTHFTEAMRSADKTSAETNRVIGEKTDDYMELATIRPDGTDLRRITHGGGYTYASFSPDGMSILHRRQRGEVSQIFLMNADGSGDHNLSGVSSTDGWPAWSPNGKRIVFSRHVENGFQIFVMNRDGSGVRQLTDAAGEFTNPRWSPDGKKILCGRRLGGISLALFDAPTRALIVSARSTPYGQKIERVRKARLAAATSLFGLLDSQD
jgi:TolB protein